MIVAAIDIGTNTVRLLVARAAHQAIEPLGRSQVITRLGRGVDAGRRLDPEAAERTIAAVGTFFEAAKEEGAERFRVVGTSALRDAADRDRFAARILETTGFPLEILAGAEEGRLSFLGATASLDPRPRIVCDIGGGSTEFVRGVRQAETVLSMDVGSVRVRERFLRDDPPAPAQVTEARAMVSSALDDVDEQLGRSGGEELVGVAGTVTTLAALAAGLETYDPDSIHLSRVGAAEVARWTDSLLGMPVDAVRELPTMQPGRADVIAAGALILNEVLVRWGLPDVLVSERDILDALAASLVWSEDASPR